MPGTSSPSSNLPLSHEAYSILVNAEWRAIYDREIDLIRAAAARKRLNRKPTDYDAPSPHPP
jgi:hypothetical protein